MSESKTDPDANSVAPERRRSPMKRLGIAIAFLGSLCVLAFSVAAYASNKGIDGETELKVLVVLAESSKEVAREPESLEAARGSFVLMFNHLADNLELVKSDLKSRSTLMNYASIRRCSLIIDEARDIASKLEDRKGKYKEPKTAIDEARDRLRKIYRVVDGAVPIAATLKNMNKTDSALPAQLIDQLSKELKQFELEIAKFETQFNETTDLSTPAQQLKFVKMGEKVCQESRLAFFLISLEWKARSTAPEQANLIDTFIQLEQRASKHCAVLSRMLPPGEHKEHVTAFTSSIERRAMVAKAYRARDWKTVAAVLKKAVESVTDDSA